MAIRLLPHKGEPDPVEVESDVPPGFRPLSAHVRAEILGTIGRDLLFAAVRPGAELTYAFRADGRIAQADAEHQVDPDRVIRFVIPEGWDASVKAASRRRRPPEPRPGGSSAGDVVDPADLVPPAVLAELDSWRVHSDGRCWRIGAPFPKKPTPEDAWLPLSVQACEAIRRHLRASFSPVSDSVGRPIGGGFSILFEVDGRYVGNSLDTDPRAIERRPFLVEVSARHHVDDLALEQIRVSPDTGEVKPQPVPLQRKQGA